MSSLSEGDSLYEKNSWYGAWDQPMNMSPTEADQVPYETPVYREEDKVVYREENKVPINRHADRGRCLAETVDLVPKGAEQTTFTVDCILGGQYQMLSMLRTETHGEVYTAKPLYDCLHDLEARRVDLNGLTRDDRRRRARTAGRLTASPALLADAIDQHKAWWFIFLKDQSIRERHDEECGRSGLNTLETNRKAHQRGLSCEEAAPEGAAPKAKNKRHRRQRQHPKPVLPSQETPTASETTAQEAEVGQAEASPTPLEQLAQVRKPEYFDELPFYKQLFGRQGSLFPHGLLQKSCECVKRRRFEAKNEQGRKPWWLFEDRLLFLIDWLPFTSSMDCFGCSGKHTLPMLCDDRIRTGFKKWLCKAEAPNGSAEGSLDHQFKENLNVAGVSCGNSRELHGFASRFARGKVACAERLSGAQRKTFANRLKVLARVFQVLVCRQSLYGVVQRELIELQHHASSLEDWVLESVANSSSWKSGAAHNQCRCTPPQRVFDPRDSTCGARGNCNNWYAAVSSILNVELSTTIHLIAEWKSRMADVKDGIWDEWAIEIEVAHERDGVDILMKLKSGFEREIKDGSKEAVHRILAEAIGTKCLY